MSMPIMVEGEVPEPAETAASELTKAHHCRQMNVDDGSADAKSTCFPWGR